MVAAIGVLEYTVQRGSTCLGARGVERGLTVFDTVCAVVHILHGRRQQTRNCGGRLGDPHLTEEAGRRSNSGCGEHPGDLSTAVASVRYICCTCANKSVLTSLKAYSVEALSLRGTK